MNIVKIADVNPETLSETFREKYLKYKNLYCYCVNWKYIVTFEDMQAAAERNGRSSEQQFVVYSAITKPNELMTLEGVPYEDYAEFVTYNCIDIARTEAINSVAKYIEFNAFNPDSEGLTVEQVKMFRTWLATTLYGFLNNGTTEYETLEMLNYYKNEMTDDTIKHLSYFSSSASSQILSTATATTCSCQKTSSALLTLSGASVCDPIALYKKAIYEYMVKVFSDISFWTEREDEFLIEFKRYIDAIIKLDLPLTSSSYVNELYDCNCLTIPDSVQERMMAILKNLSTALGYMINDEVSGHKNFIGDTLYNWSAKLYEIMRW